ncbi:hypothetical protein CPB83DRAFT_940082 [Crepidotus variabilis]|uniref:F-box domain-containing protein n=1 Tax=Crepidotus variabilis TaxID=179855 RepID=A0A9P6EBX0_9AGAR|nr:hypothetical protein CPB83DRAFT_940082 [Crepidotus variabilis]
MTLTLNFDLIARILEFIQDDFKLLANCSLVNSEFNLAASKLLYRRVVVSPKPESQQVLNLINPGAIPKNSNFTSAFSLRNKDHVLVLEISGSTSTRAPPRNTLPANITKALETFVNLRSVQFTPSTWNNQLFTTALPILPTLLFLDDLEVNASCLDEPNALSLSFISGLRRLSIWNPSRAILQLLPDRLDRLSVSLVDLALESNCGSVTPGVLKAILAHIKSNVRRFTLGLSYSLTNEDVFGFLSQLPMLEHLQLHYYWQLKPPTAQPNLRSLQFFKATFSQNQMCTKVAVFHLDKWIRQVITRSSKLEELQLVPSADPEDYISPISHTPLIEHICARHANIRVLSLRGAFINATGLKRIFSTCLMIEELSALVGSDCLTILATHKTSLLHLHTISFQICNTPRPRRYKVARETVERLMNEAPFVLRRLTVNQTLWKVRSIFKSTRLISG